ncbi:MAG: hypothetical protein ABR587_02215 [Candidatus Binatia bacterium]
MRTSTSETSRSPAFKHLAFRVIGAALLTATTVSASTGGIEPSLPKVDAPSAGDFIDGSYTCTIPQLAVVSERRQRIADAETVEEARALALNPARAARKALQFAALVAPSSADLAAARDRIEGFEGRVEQSGTPADVAGEFDRLLSQDMLSGELIQVADLNVGQAQVRGPGRCHYTTGEIVAIVFGFILFVIPGIILLFVLC